jgi:hypothetical protein
MKNFLFVLLTMSVCFVSNAQIKTPSASPSAKIMQTIGLTDVTVEYSRPSMKGRTIFSADGLVPFGKMWRTGANQATKITFSDDVMVGGVSVPAGSYAVLTIPTATQWTINFYKHESTSWSSYTEKTPDAAVKVKPQMLPMDIETYTVAVSDLTMDSGTLEMMWERTKVGVKVTASVDERVMADIDKVLAGPTANDYYAAGNYLHTSGKDLEKALMYVQKATNVDKPKFWQVRRESLILADMGKVDEAVRAAKKSLDLAKAAGNDDYVKMNQNSINKWTSMNK